MYRTFRRGKLRIGRLSDDCCPPFLRTVEGEAEAEADDPIWEIESSGVISLVLIRGLRDSLLALIRKDADGGGGGGEVCKSNICTVFVLLLLSLETADDESGNAAGSVMIWEPLRLWSGPPLEEKRKSRAWLNRLAVAPVVLPVLPPALLPVVPLLISEPRPESEPEVKEPELIEGAGSNSRSPPYALERLGLGLLERHDDLEPRVGFAELKAKLRGPGPGAGPGQLGPEIAPLLVLKYFFRFGEGPPPVPQGTEGTSDIPLDEASCE